METIIIGKQEFPASCPQECPLKKEPFYQGNLCSRCPIFNCAGDFRLIEPDDYREDWAASFKVWFESGFSSYVYPKLYLTNSFNN